jgi:hypothetical protein
LLQGSHTGTDDDREEMEQIPELAIFTRDKIFANGVLNEAADLSPQATDSLVEVNSRRRS